MSEDRWVRIVDPQHVLRADIDEVWHPKYGTYGWKSVFSMAGKAAGACAAYKVRCRLRDVPPETQIVDSGPDHELVEPWERDPAGVTEYWGLSTQSWRRMPCPHDTLTDSGIYRRPIAKPVSKTPQPGEWWFANYMSERLFFHGRNQHGHLFFESKSGCTSAISKDDWSDWHHEPDCTGWDWQPPKPEAQPEELQTYNITVPITDREREVLLRLSGIVDLPPDRVMIQALRHYQTVIEPVNPLTLASANSEAEPEPLTLEQRVEALEQQVQKLERQVNEWEDSQ